MTLWYAAVFSFCFLAVFGAFYCILHNHFYRWTDAELKEEVLEGNIAYQESGLAGVLREFKDEEATERGSFMGRIISPEGLVVFEIGPAFWATIGLNDELVQRARSGHNDVEMLEFGEGHAARIIYSQLPDGSIVQLGFTLLEHETWMDQFSRDLGKVAAFALALSVGAGGFMARRALSPIQKIACTASAISGRSMGQRVPVSGREDEVDQLATSFNGMLDRIDTLVEGVRGATDTLAHDLRTPLSGIRGKVEMVLRSRDDPSEHKVALYQIMEQLDRLFALFDTILDVAEAEAGALALRSETIWLESLVNDTVQTFGPVAEDRGIQLEAKVAPNLVVEGDKGRLGQVLFNLTDNALKYTPSGGSVRLIAERGDSPKEIILSVTDTGMGVSEKDLPHIFERYYRGDKSRSGDGAGLGLPLVNGIVKAHGGHMTVESRPGEGTAFRVFLPINPINRYSDAIGL